MCGIIGYTGKRSAAAVLLDGLTRLEYRGYDSAGIAVSNSKGIPEIHKSQGKLSALKKMLGNKLPQGNTGIGHTRWATHGGTTDSNAHPHTDCKDNVVVVHNGIVENFIELKKELESEGHTFESQTDSECIPHLIETYMDRDYSLEEAIRKTAGRLRGAHAVVAINTQLSGDMVAFRIGNAGGIVVGYGNTEMFLSSDLPAVLPYTSKVAYLSGGELVYLSKHKASYTNLNGDPVQKQISDVPDETISAAKGEYEHFMLKEIHEQPEAVIYTMRGRVSFDPPNVSMDGFNLSDKIIRNTNRIVLLGMGTSLHAAMVGRNWIESMTNIPTEVDNSSEFRYRDPILDDKTLVISICQSGETADTLAAMEKAAAKGAKLATLCNYEGTQTTRIADATLYIRAGLEIGVAASKTFICSLTALYILSAYLGIKRDMIDSKGVASLVRNLAHLPDMLGEACSNVSDYKRLAKQYAKYSNFLYIGRGILFPIAMEGALKLKEISYIHAEGYQAAEMKHGPISLIDDTMPVLALIPQDKLYEKMLSNISEATARGGRVIAIATEGDNQIAEMTENVIYVPKSPDIVSPILMAVPMQLLAYYIALERGCDVDHPRNLAKSVTVE